jgi:ribosomal protein S18 acetylase RimI-like enzyme
MRERIIEIARSLGRKSMILAGGVQARNDRGLHFYEKMGFRPVREFETVLKNIDMVRDLAQRP